MSGWRRLWIVFSILLGIPSGLLAWHSWRTEQAWINPDAQDLTLNKDQFIKIMESKAIIQNSKINDCIKNGSHGEQLEGAYFRVYCERSLPLVSIISLIFSLIPAFIMAITGLAIRWIYRGFHPLAQS